MSNEMDWNLVFEDFFGMTPKEAALAAANGNEQVALFMEPFFVQLAIEWRKTQT